MIGSKIIDTLLFTRRTQTFYFKDLNTFSWLCFIHSIQTRNLMKTLKTRYSRHNCLRLPLEAAASISRTLLPYQPTLTHCPHYPTLPTPYYPTPLSTSYWPTSLLTTSVHPTRTPGSISISMTGKAWMSTDHMFCQWAQVSWYYFLFSFKSFLYYPWSKK